MADVIPNKTSFKSRFVNAFMPKPGASRLRKESTTENDASRNRRQSSTGGSTLQGQDVPASDASWDDVDEQTGERDYTGLLHGLAHHESFDSLDSLSKKVQVVGPYREPGDSMIASLPVGIWEQIGSQMTPTDAANLAVASKTLQKLLGPIPWITLDHPDNYQYKIDFLLGMDSSLPNHLCCFPCAIYHLRTQRGHEVLKASHVLNPLFNCPNATTPGRTTSRARLTTGHHLPFTFVQLVMRAHRYGPRYGIPADTLSRRYKDRESDWMHQTRYYVHKNRLLLRVVSRTFAPPGLPTSGQRHLLYSREDYFPYFSVCAHWRDGELMNICKCALGHVVKPKESIAQQLRRGPQVHLTARSPDYFVTQCSLCRPMRRCPDCPTEYLVELKLAEDKNDAANQFKQALIVTRWSDLGDGRKPMEGPWAACNGEVEFDSWKAIGKRALSGIFESQSGVTIHGQTVLNLNPKHEKKGEEGHNWY